MRKLGGIMDSFKQYTSPFNPFNSWKIAFHIERMKEIGMWLDEGDHGNLGKMFLGRTLPPPVYVTIDPSDACNHECPFCISGMLNAKDSTILSKDLLLSLADVLCDWDDGDFSIEAVSIAGGGEPLANKHTAEFMRKLAENFESLCGPEFALISNGELLTDEVIEVLAESASWAGFSIDAGNSVDHFKMHRSKKNGEYAFDKIIENVSKLCKRRDKVDRNPKLNVGYKFNVHPDSYASILQAAGLAKSIGCNQISYRPVHLPNAAQVYPPIIESSQNGITQARKLYEDENFLVHGVIHKFGKKWEPIHDFGSCTMTSLGLVFSANGELYICCDRRGDDKMSLGKWHDGKVARLNMIKSAWGSKRHYELVRDINLKECPRCSLYFYNKLFQEAILKDSMNRNFL